MGSRGAFVVDATIAYMGNQQPRDGKSPTARKLRTSQKDRLLGAAILGGTAPVLYVGNFPAILYITFAVAAVICLLAAAVAALTASGQTVWQGLQVWYQNTDTKMIGRWLYDYRFSLLALAVTLFIWALSLYP